ncbi:VWA domain-containing protein [Kitasatospora atroaurantiaca]|uniref:VWA domain-containing protein n=1 Tax=Kitasatospora atroaurantiaca TaxID=285545 RepID=UPI001FE5DA61|nr:VWA domain-containing protein [Kitasatospora atroaurantiaca]
MTATAAPAPDLPSTAKPAISLTKLQAEAPALVSLYKQAAVSLSKSGLDGRRAAVYLVLDHSASMSRLYRNGAVQRLAEQSLALSANLDDDGTVPVVLFNDRSYSAQDVEISEHRGAVERVRKACGAKFGGTNFAPAMRTVLEHYQACGATDPAFVIFQTDGAAADRRNVRKLLQESSGLPVFWQFVGFGEPDARMFSFLRTLDSLDGRTVGNTGFCATGKNPTALSDADLYARLLSSYPAWITAARAAGIIR